MRDRTTSVNPPSGAPSVPSLPEGGTNVLFDIWLLSRATTGMVDSALAPTGLTADEFGVYSVLMSADTVTPSELAHWMSAPATTVSSYVKRIEGRGHLVRRRNPDDGRSFVLQLTDEGRAAHGAGVEAFIPVLAAVQERLGSKEAGARKALATLKAAVDEAVPSLGGR